MKKPITKIYGTQQVVSRETHSNTGLCQEKKNDKSNKPRVLETMEQASAL